VSETGQQVLILGGADWDSHILNPPLVSLVSRVVLDKSVQTVVSDPELDVLGHGLGCQ